MFKKDRYYSHIMNLYRRDRTNKMLLIRGEMNKNMKKIEPSWKNYKIALLLNKLKPSERQP